MQIELSIQNRLQSDWHMTHIIRLGEASWQVNISDGEHVAVATGSCIEEALMNAQVKANEGDFVGRLFHLAPLRSPEAQASGNALLASLGLGKAKLPIKRRI